MIDDIIEKIKNSLNIPVLCGIAPDGNDCVVYSVTEVQSDNVIRDLTLTLNIISHSFSGAYAYLDIIRNNISGENNSAVLVKYSRISKTSLDKFGMFTLTADFNVKIKGLAL